LPFKTPNLDVLIDLAFPGFPDRVLIGLGINVRAAHDVPVIVAVVEVIVRHNLSPTELKPDAPGTSKLTMRQGRGETLDVGVDRPIAGLATSQTAPLTHRGVAQEHSRSRNFPIKHVSCFGRQLLDGERL
jgi:hypothetical protein